MRPAESCGSIGGGQPVQRVLNGPCCGDREIGGREAGMGGPALEAIRLRAQVKGARVREFDRGLEPQTLLRGARHGCG